MGLFSPQKREPEIERPVLELSGPALTAAIERLASGCEQTGGIEAYVKALRLKSEAFRKLFDEAGPQGPDAEQFAVIAGLMPTVRRRIGTYLEGDKFEELRGAIMRLVKGRHDPATVDQRIAEFCVTLPNDRKHRWVKDLAGELLHALDPERYPLMCRWVWDVKANTGVLREIWHGDVDRATIEVGDGYAMHIMLREELSQFLADNGVFRDTLYYIDLVLAQVYAEYIAAQGGSYLRADFSAAEDTNVYLRRLLGLDGVRIKHSDPAVAHAARQALPGF